jgi:hypothetical protein
MTHQISLNEAITMTSTYRTYREEILKTEYQGLKILPICETFDKTEVNQLLSEEGCSKLRIYYGMDENKNVHAILVGVNVNDEDILPASNSLSATEEEEILLERAVRCPENCPPESSLNT